MVSLKRWRVPLCAAAFATVLPGATQARTLAITSVPVGATIEIDGIVVGTTPYEAHYPGGYFKKPHSVFSTRLEHAMVARISKEGYIPQQIDLTEGPFRYITINGKYHGDYWLLKSDHFEVTLEPVGKALTGAIQFHPAAQMSAPAGPGLAVEKVVRRASRAVLLLQREGGGSGSGFFVTETGVIATNRHVAEKQTELRAWMASGAELVGRVVYVDPHVDLALLKVEGNGFPTLPLADPESVQQGEAVLAIGNPGRGLASSVTRGIVSAVGPLADLGPGTWIQTDAAINPGDSGGPLLNLSGEVVGIVTRKEFFEHKTHGRSLQGIGFALSVQDLLSVLRRFYPSETPIPGNRSPQSFGSLRISSDPTGADIYVDGKFVGNTPSTLRLAAGTHHIQIKMAGKQTWERNLDLLPESKVTLRPSLASSGR